MTIQSAKKPKIVKTKSGRTRDVGELTGEWISKAVWTECHQDWKQRSVRKLVSWRNSNVQCSVMSVEWMHYEQKARRESTVNGRTTCSRWQSALGIISRCSQLTILKLTLHSLHHKLRRCIRYCTHRYIIKTCKPID